MKSMTILGMFSLMLVLGACNEQGPAEEMGERIDEAAADMSRAAEDAAEEISQ